MNRLYWSYGFLPPLLLTLGACQSTQPIAAWQQRLTDYTMMEGQGDLNVLRESAELRSPDSVRPAQIRFDQIDIAPAGPFGERIDANGVMVGQRTDGGNPVYYFVVGVLKRPSSGRGPELKDIRLVSCSLQDGMHAWRTSPPNPESLRRYLESRQGTIGPGGSSPGETFPRLDDDFRMDVQGGVAKTTETHSGATWILASN